MTIVGTTFDSIKYLETSAKS